MNTSSSSLGEYKSGPFHSTAMGGNERITKSRFPDLPTPMAFARVVCSSVRSIPALRNFSAVGHSGASNRFSQWFTPRCEYQRPSSQENM